MPILQREKLVTRLEQAYGLREVPDELQLPKKQSRLSLDGFNYDGNFSF